ncbi:MAG: exodeoxyribonuclease I [Desulfobacteraceae bacterium]|nr:MAG: exodeoxyribonuclease I [Desulfobacteraceae bacterium]
MNSYLFYDLETSGLNKAFDQIMQFAAIRTDMQLNEIEKHNFLVKLRPDTIVSPKALITHRISISDTMTGACEYEAAKTIHRLMNEPGTISIGYNTLGFDDEFLRFTFHRNLLPPYTHQYHHGCGRMDIFPIAIMFHLYRDKVLSWPQKNGKTSFKLEDLNTENNLTNGVSHDALADVEATIALARRFMKEADMWNYLAGNFVKETDRRRADSLPALFHDEQLKYSHGIMVGSEFGKDMRFQAPVLYIGNSIPYVNQTLWLRMDLPELRETNMETIHETTWVIRKRYGEPGILLPPLERYKAMIGEIRMAECRQNTNWIKSHMEVFHAITRYHQTFRYPEIPDLDADAALYQMGFPTKNTEALCRKFHLAPFSAKVNMIGQIESSETRTLAKRLLARNFPEALPQSLKQEFLQYLSKINPKSGENAIVDYRGEARTTPVGALTEIKEMKQAEGMENRQRKLLDELEEYLIQTFQGS